jgi:hypothetical protein
MKGQAGGRLPRKTIGPSSAVPLDTSYIQHVISCDCDYPADVSSKPVVSSRRLPISELCCASMVPGSDTLRRDEPKFAYSTASSLHLSAG